MGIYSLPPLSGKGPVTTLWPQLLLDCLSPTVSEPQVSGHHSLPRFQAYVNSPPFIVSLHPAHTSENSPF